MSKQIEVTEVSSGASKLYLVKDSGVVLGFLEKYKHVSGETHPWKAYDAIVGQGSVPQVGRNMKAFYGRTGKSDAITHLKGLR